MKHTIQALVENKFGVLSRVASLFSARGYNIESLAVGETQNSAISCMTIVVDAPDERILEQIKKQLHKLIDVITVEDFTRKDYVDRDLLLTKIANNEGNKPAIESLVKQYPIRVIDANKEYYLLEICVQQQEEEDIFKELSHLGIKELVRTGRIAIGK